MVERQGTRPQIKEQFLMKPGTYQMEQKGVTGCDLINWSKKFGGNIG